MLQHVHLIDWSWLTIYLGGSFCKLEIDIKVGSCEYTHQFFTTKGFYNQFTACSVDTGPHGSGVAVIIRKKPGMVHNINKKGGDE